MRAAHHKADREASEWVELREQSEGRLDEPGKLAEYTKWMANPINAAAYQRMRWLSERASSPSLESYGTDEFAKDVAANLEKSGTLYSRYLLWKMWRLRAADEFVHRNVQNAKLRAFLSRAISIWRSSRFERCAILFAPVAVLVYVFLQ